ncbi:MAG TPA: sulfotransferase [Acidimicrobiales bacterium]
MAGTTSANAGAGTTPAARAIHVDDLAVPRLPGWYRAVDRTVCGPLAAGRWGRLDADDLLAAAGASTTTADGVDVLADLDGGGDGTRVRAALEALLDSAEREADLRPVGRIMVRQLVIQLVRTRLAVQDLLRRHPEILQERIERPIVILGLPRTGTTHLHELLAADPALRSLPYWESLEPVGPGPDGRPPATGPDPRVARCSRALALLHRVMPLFPAMHEMTPEGPHEEIQLLAVDFTSMLFEASYQVPSYRDWYRAADQAPAYRTLRTMLQVLQWLRGGERWVLKSPQHLEQLPALLAAFPDATLVQTHRDPVPVLASVSTMIAYTRRSQHRRVDPVQVGRDWSARIEEMLHRNVVQRDALAADPAGADVLDVRFHELMPDVVGGVRRIYEQAGQPWTATTEAVVRARHAAAPRGRHGRLSYRLADLGIDPAERRAALRFYQARFAVPDEETA